MSATGCTPISLYYSTTASAAPTAGNLVNGELGINITDGKLYYKDNLGAVQLLASKAGASGSVTSVAQSFTGGLISVSGSPITTSGTLALTVAGTSGGVPYFSSASTWASSAALAANAIVLGGGAGAAPATTTTGTGVVTAVGNAVNTTGGLVTQSGTLAASAILLGGGASTAISSTTTGTGVVTALGVNTGSAGAFVVNGGALGTPSSGTVTNLTGTASININGTVGATTQNTGYFTTVRLYGSTSGYVGLAPAAAAGSTTYTLPSADGSNGQTLTTNGSGTLSWATAGGSSSPIPTQDIKTTGTSQTWTIPSGVTKVKVTMIGGGGGGGGANGCSFTTGSGGGAGGYAVVYLTGLTAGNTLTYTVGGAGGTTSLSSGTVAPIQTITTVTCTGGAGGSASTGQINGGAGGTSTGGTININGGYGNTNPGGGGVSPFGGAGAAGDNAGFAATGYGSGGGGAFASTGGGKSGGAGKAGVIIFEY